MEKKYYVYVHRRATDGSVFYVGKGKGRRAWSKSRQNPHWHNVVKKNGYTVHVLALFDNEACAFSFERALIKHYGRDKLCNLTDGGDGVSGYKFTDETLAKLRPKRVGLKMSDENKAALSERWKTSLNPSKNMSEKHRAALSSSHVGYKFKQETRDKKSKLCTGLGNPAAKRNKVWFSHQDHGLFFCAEYTLRVMFNLDRGRLADLVRCKMETYKGWIIFT